MFLQETLYTLRNVYLPEIANINYIISEQIRTCSFKHQVILSSDCVGMQGTQYRIKLNAPHRKGGKWANIHISTWEIKAGKSIQPIKLPRCTVRTAGTRPTGSFTALSTSWVLTKYCRTPLTSPSTCRGTAGTQPLTSWDVSIRRGSAASWSKARVSPADRKRGCGERTAWEQGGRCPQLCVNGSVPRPSETKNTKKHQRIR